jgi:predicted phosphodiesterase
MRVLVLSDIHGNLAALEAAIATPHDAMVCLGDLVGYGPSPGPVVRSVRASAILALQGNHDRALADGVAPGCRAQFEWLAQATFSLGQQQLAPEEIAYLGALPRQALRVFDGVRYLFVHATPSDPLYRYLGPEPDVWAKEATGVDADVVVVGHTHIQFELALAGKRVVNPGSVGQPKDGDPRAAYAVLEDGGVRLCRTAYSVERTIDAFQNTGVPLEAVSALGSLLRTGRVSANTVAPS